MTVAPGASIYTEEPASVHLELSPEKVTCKQREIRVNKTVVIPSTAAGLVT